jgi:methionyl-tRNA synthetase
LIHPTKEWALREGKEWEPYWKDQDTKLVHFIGKDNIVFHCIIPAMLKAEGSYILPDNVPANEFLNLEGNKLSTLKKLGGLVARIFGGQVSKMFCVMH